MESIGERLRIIRKTEKLTLEDFGKRLGAKKSTISQLENGKNNLTEQMKVAICKEYNVNRDWLENGTGDRKSTRLNSSHRCTSRMPSSA